MCLISLNSSFCSALYVLFRGTPPKDPQVAHLLTPERIAQLEGVTLDQVRAGCTRCLYFALKI